MPSAKFRNSDSALIIDESYANLALRQSGSFTSGGANAYGYSIATVTLAHDQSVLAIRPNGRVGIHHVTYGTGKITYTFWCLGSNVAISYWNFDLPKYSTYNSGFAKLIIRNPATGEVCFDSRLRYMRVLNFQIVQASSSAPQMDQTYASGTVPAVIIANQPWAMRSERTGNGSGSVTIVAWALGTVYASGTSISIRPLESFASFSDTNLGNAYPNSDMASGFWITVDVSNF